MHECVGCYESTKTSKIRLISAAGYDQVRLRYRFEEADYYLCAPCLKKYYRVCKACSLCYHSNGVNVKHCPRCNTSDAILRFDYDPCKKLKNFYNEFGAIAPEAASMSGEMYFGVELEVVIKGDHAMREVADSAQAALGDKFAVLKYDGTVNKDGIRGFELVSAPATMPFHLKAWRNFFEFAKQSQYFEREHANAGMHVHMSRTALDNNMIKRMVHLIYGKHNQEFVRGVAQRPANKYCDYSPASANHLENHYTALNRCKPRTVELRIFQGIVDEEVFSKNLEFCAALYEYVRNTSSNEPTDFHFEPFAEYVQADSELYPNLSKYLGKLGCIDKQRKMKKLSLVGA